MRYAIVTPTICRPSLLRLCESVDGQVQTDWEHLVIVDLPRQEMTQSQQGSYARFRRAPTGQFFSAIRDTITTGIPAGIKRGSA